MLPSASFDEFFFLGLVCILHSIGEVHNASVDINRRQTKQPCAALSTQYLLPYTVEKIRDGNGQFIDFSNKLCTFPFVYNNTLHTSCIPDNTSGRSWCAVTCNYDRDKMRRTCTKKSREIANLFWALPNNKLRWSNNFEASANVDSRAAVCHVVEFTTSLTLRLLRIEFDKTTLEAGFDPQDAFTLESSSISLSNMEKKDVCSQNNLWREVNTAKNISALDKVIEFSPHLSSNSRSPSIFRAQMLRVRNLFSRKFVLHKATVMVDSSLHSMEIPDFISESFAINTQQTVRNTVKKLIDTKQSLKHTVEDPIDAQKLLPETEKDLIITKQPLSNKVKNSIDAKQPLTNKVNDSIDAKQPSTNKIKNSIDAKQPSTNKVKDSIDAKQPSTNKVKDSIDVKQPSTNKVNDSIDAKQPSTNKVTDSIDVKQPSTNKVNDSIDSKQPSTNKVKDLIDSKQPMTNKVKDSFDAKQPLTNKVKDSIDAKQPSTNTMNDLTDAQPSIKKITKKNEIDEKQYSTKNDLSKSLLKMKVSKSESDLKDFKESKNQNFNSEANNGDENIAGKQILYITVGTCFGAFLILCLGMLMFTLWRARNLRRAHGIHVEARMARHHRRHKQRHLKPEMTVEQSAVAIPVGDVDGSTLGVWDASSSTRDTNSILSSSVSGTWRSDSPDLPEIIYSRLPLPPEQPSLPSLTFSTFCRTPMYIIESDV